VFGVAVVGNSRPR